MKFLLVGGGRRNQLCLYMLEKNIQVHSYELDINCPISLYSSKVIQGKTWKDKNLKNDLLKLSSDYDLIIPLMDEATKILSELNLKNVCASNFKTTNLCLNKKIFENYFLSDNDLRKYYPIPDGSEVVVKPVNGFSSIGITFMNNSPKISKDYVVQKRIYGQEYSVDCFCDENNNLVDFVPRKRIKVSSGEVIESVTVSKNKFEEIVGMIIKKIPFKGPICIQFIEDENENLWIMEINARMGGGSTLSIAAGLDIIELMISCFCNKNFLIEKYQSNWKTNFYLKRFYLDYCYEDKKICI